MAHFTLQPTHTLHLTTEEFVLVSKGLNALTTPDGVTPLPAAQKLRDYLSRARATQTIQLAEPAHRLLEKLPPADHDYFKETAG